MQKFLISSIFLLFLIFLSHEFYYLDKKNEYEKDIHNKKSEEIIAFFNDEVEKKFGKTFALTNLLSKDKKLIEALVKKDNSLLDYSEIIEETQNFGEYKNLWIQIIDKDGYSFYRSWTNRIGDHAASARIDIVDMIKNPRPMRGISTGRFDMTFKTMIPLYDNGKFVGIIEMISKFNSIARVLKKYDIEPLMVVHEDYTTRFIKPFTSLFIGNNYVANLNASKSLMKKVKIYGLKKLMYLEKPILFDKYLVTTTQIKDIHGGEMGFFIFFFDEKKLDKSKIYNFRFEYSSQVIVAVVIYVLFILFLLNKNYVGRLNEEVEKKTLKIDKQKKKLKDLLNVYDNNVIFSKTDLKGYITYVSKAFCEISGYTKDELIGKPHNIIRHPDMKKTVFKELWTTIQSGKVWENEVKNLKKDGGYYWVYSRVEPVYNQENRIIEYISTRTDITAKKKYEEHQLKMLNQTRMTALGEMLSNIAHQWRQPLSIITSVASSVSLKQELKMLKEVDLEKEMKSIMDSANYLSNIIESFRNFIRNDKEFKAVSIKKSVDDVLQILDTTIKSNHINIINNIEKNDIVIGMISGELEQVLINIINNANEIFIERNIQDKNIILNLKIEKEIIIITLEDNAGGIPDDIINKIFDAYFTTKHKSQGTGLGLYMSYRIVTESLKGNLFVKNTDKGAKFFIEIPIKYDSLK
ncbi:PAS domain-containing protein [Arcobacter arenosus]|uniref:histidine kinase n=1 Tax=Arcobacter arenosus TaxID=2576037 RepID=A0A5R8Y5U0_9BACT|nr:PAS domain-containing protein [Arcobacter arenosus]TLP41150.1 PAS domain S-box protein [Arcobacter arenosus]